MKSTAFRFFPGDVLYGRLRPYLNKVYLADAEGLCSSEFIVLPPCEAVLPKFLSYRLRHSSFVEFANHQNQGDRPRVNFEQISSFQISLPPKKEQDRIVAKLEGLLGEVDACRKRLERIPLILKRFRQSVLAAACSGRLTEDWRKSQSKAETGHSLLERISSERSDGETNDVAAEDELREALPDSWALATPGILGAPERYALAIGPFGSNLKVSDYRSSGVPLVFVRHIRSGAFDGQEPKFVSKEKAKGLAAHSVSSNDLLITKMGAPPGDCEIYPSGRPDAIITADCIKFRVWERHVNRVFVKHVINSFFVKNQLGLLTKGVAQQKISLERFRTIGLPLPSRKEQDEIVNRIESLFKLADQIESRYDAAKASVDQLTQSVLAKAFRGELVPQDPEDEPADRLLARVRVARSEACLRA